MGITYEALKKLVVDEGLPLSQYPNLRTLPVPADTEELVDFEDAIMEAEAMIDVAFDNSQVALAFLSSLALLYFPGRRIGIEVTEKYMADETYEDTLTLSELGIIILSLTDDNVELVIAENFGFND